MIFELKNTESLLQIEPVKLVFPNAETEWDRNVVQTIIRIKAGGFSASYNAEILTFDFEKLKQGLDLLYSDLKGSFSFECMERYLTIKVSGDGLGHFNGYCIAIDKPGTDENELHFTIFFDQTQIRSLVNQLDIITKAFPISGDFKIRNK